MNTQNKQIRKAVFQSGVWTGQGQNSSPEKATVLRYVTQYGI